MADEDTGSKRSFTGEDSGRKAKRFMFTSSPGSSRTPSFRKPGSASESGQNTPADSRVDNLKRPQRTGSPLQKVLVHTPIPAALTPGTAGPSRNEFSSTAELNKLQAKVLRAKLMGDPKADELEKQYERAKDAGNSREKTRTEVLPTLNAQGRLYDVGQGSADEPAHAHGSGNRKKKEKITETRDLKTGLRTDKDSTSVLDLLRQEKIDAGAKDQDAQLASAIMGDGKYENDLDYIDDNAEKFGRQKMRSEAKKRQFVLNDYKRSQKALESCTFCFADDDSPPKAPMIAMGTRVYLSCTTNEELVDGHCLIVPIQHHFNMLEGDDDVWDEVRNFMKCLMRMYAEEDKGVAFYETVISLKWQKHTFIECVPLPWDKFDDMPGYFKESILQSEAEWSQHKKLIDFSARPGGFRRAMVPNLPYFMIQFDHKGEKGYGHVIEGSGEQDERMGDETGNEFPSYFAGEVIGNVLEIESRRWRRPKRVDFKQNKQRVAKFIGKYSKFDWTGAISRQN